MTATEWAAWVGATSGVGGLFWNVYLKVTAGPRLNVTATAGMIKMPRVPGNPSFMLVTVQNRGTAATTITNLGLCVFDSWWKRKRRKGTQYFVIANYEGRGLPVKLEVGEQWQATMQQDERFETLLRSDNLWCSIHDSFSKHPVYAKILAPTQDEKPSTQSRT